MRSLVRDKQPIWFCDVSESLDGIDTVKTYSDPIKKYFTVSATAGWVNNSGSGWILNYDRQVVCYERDFRPPEGTMLFVDVVPEIDADGHLKTIDVQDVDANGNPALDEDGDPITYKKYVTEPDYIIKKIYNTQRGTVARFGISKV